MRLARFPVAIAVVTAVVALWQAKAQEIEIQECALSCKACEDGDADVSPIFCVNGKETSQRILPRV